MFVVGEFSGGNFETAAAKHLTITGGEAMVFNGKQEHWSTPFDGGDRISVVFFAHNMAVQLSQPDRDYLIRLGFGLRTEGPTSATTDNKLTAPIAGSGNPRDTEPSGHGSIVRNFVHGCCEKGSLMTRPTPPLHVL